MEGQQNTERMHAKKSTNVRLSQLGALALLSGFKLFRNLWPALAVKFATTLFVYSQRKTPRAHERDILRTATPMRIAGRVAWSWGSGPVVILAHGWEGRASQLGAFVEPLVSRAYQVIAFDQFGHGDSTGILNSYPGFARGIREVAKAVGSVHAIIGHSMGAAATALAIYEGLRIKRAVFIASPSDLRNYLNQFATTLNLTADLKARVQKRLEARVGYRLSEIQTARVAPIMTTPLRIIHDENDREVPISNAKIIAEAWPNAELVITRDLGHQRILNDAHVVQSAIEFIGEPQKFALSA